MIRCACKRWRFAHAPGRLTTEKQRRGAGPRPDAAAGSGGRSVSTSRPMCAAPDLTIPTQTGRAMFHPTAGISENEVRVTLPTQTRRADKHRVERPQPMLHHPKKGRAIHPGHGSQGPSAMARCGVSAGWECGSGRSTPSRRRARIGQSQRWLLLGPVAYAFLRAAAWRLIRPPNTVVMPVSMLRVNPRVPCGGARWRVGVSDVSRSVG